MKTKKQRKWCGARKECLRSFFVLLENDQRRTVEKGVKTCISMNLPTAENLLRRGNWRNNSGNAGIQGFCEEPAFKADIKYAGHYPVLWSPVPVWNNPKEPSDWEKVFFCEQWRAWRYWSGDWDEAGEFSRLRKEIAGKRNIQKILLVNIW